MEKKKILQDHNGNESSTRHMAWYFMWFFFIINTMIVLPVGLAIVFAKSIPAIDINWIIAFLAFDFLLLLAIFAPKYLTKLAEVREIISLALPNNSAGKGE